MDTNTQTTAPTRRHIYPYMLWGYHPRLRGPAGMIPVKLSGGSLRQCAAAGRRWTRDYPGIKLGTYPTGAAPIGLRLQCEIERRRLS